MEAVIMDAVVRPLVDATVDLSVNSVKQGIGVRKRIEAVRKNFETHILPCLKDAHLSVVGMSKDKCYYVYLRKAQDIWDDIQDLMELYNNEFPKDPKQTKLRNWGKARLLSLPSRVRRFHSMGGALNGINEEIKKFIKDYKRSVTSTTAVPKQTDRHRSSSEVDESKIVGRDKENAILKGMLGCSDDMPVTNTNHVVVNPTIASTSITTAVKYIFITAPTGYGKTALVQFVIKDKNVQDHFKGNIYWVSVSGSIDDKRRLATAMIEAMEGNAPEYHEWDPLHCHLRNCIQKKEIMLLVLDDSCGVDQVTWDKEVKPCFDAAAPGSRILVTTHLTNLSTQMGVSRKDTLPLGRLMEDDSWSLLCDTALPGQSEEQIRDFEVAGKKLLAQGCEGVPSVIHRLGLCLRGKETPQEWNSVIKNGIWSLNSIPEGIPNLFPPHLSVIYDEFSPALQRCLKSCACLPYGEINVDILVKYWMGLGFLNEMETEMEEQGNKYVNMLKTSSFLHVSETGGYCKFYRHVYVFAQFLAGNESCNYTDTGNSKYTGDDDTRHLTVVLGDNDTDHLPGPFSNARKLRMLKLQEPLKAPPMYVFTKSPYLKVLEMRCTSPAEIPAQVSKLKHLKTLILSGSGFLTLPETICDLKSLQTLILNDCEELTELPEKIGQLQTLRHLEMKNTDKLKKFPRGFGKLINLRTLSKFVVSAQGLRKGSRIEELKELNLLQGHLEIRGLNRVKSGIDAMEAALVNKTGLQSLCLDFEHNLSQNPEKVQIMEQVLEALKPNQEMQINNVLVRNYPETARTPSWMMATTSIE